MISYAVNTMHILQQHYTNLEQGSKEAEEVHGDIMELSRMLKPLYKETITSEIKLIPDRKDQEH